MTIDAQAYALSAGWTDIASIWDPHPAARFVEKTLRRFSPARRERERLLQSLVDQAIIDAAEGVEQQVSFHLQIGGNDYRDMFQRSFGKSLRIDVFTLRMYATETLAVINSYPMKTGELSTILGCFRTDDAGVIETIFCRQLIDGLTSLKKDDFSLVAVNYIVEHLRDCKLLSMPLNDLAEGQKISLGKALEFLLSREQPASVNRELISFVMNHPQHLDDIEKYLRAYVTDESLAPDVKHMREYVMSANSALRDGAL